MRRALDLGFKCALVSNGLKWSPLLRSEILPRFTWVRVSIDAGTPATYAHTRGTSIDAWDRVLSHLSDLCGQVAVQKTSCLVGVGWVVTPENWRELVDGVRVAKECGAANVRLSALFSPDWEKPYLPIYEQIKDLIHEARDRYQDAGFIVHDRFGDRIQDLVDANPDYKSCHYMKYTTYVGGDLNNYVCCVYSYSKRGLLTSLKDKPFDEWWASDERKQFMDNFDARQCVRCMFNPKNRALNTLVEEDLLHREFP
jgi:MoaA/NifB/PqqE/SkfB family radical SAM enzyme